MIKKKRTPSKNKKQTRKCLSKMWKRPKVYGTYKNGADIYKNKKGYYIVDYVPKLKCESLKYLKSLKKFISSKR